MVTLRIVDETIRFQEEEVGSLYTPDYGAEIKAVDHLVRLERGAPNDTAVHQTSDDVVEFHPRATMSVVRVEACNPDSLLGVLMISNELEIVRSCLPGLGSAGMVLLDRENEMRSELHRMSKTLGGDGLEPVSMIQFYAVFQLALNSLGDKVVSVLEGVLRLDKIDMAIDEAALHGR